MIYIATFYSHFGAMRYDIACREAGIASRTMPVPRELSSSCGTCVRCEERWLRPQDEVKDEMEKIVALGSDSYETVYDPEVD